MKIRLFIALEIPADALETIISIRDEIYGSDKTVKWEPKNKLHITLKYLGDVDSQKVNLISSSIERIVNSTNYFLCSFEKFGLFYKNGQPKIFWVGTKQNDNLNRFAELIDREMNKLGFEKEHRKFKAHLTLLRLKGTENIQNIEKLVNHKLSEIIFNADTVSLIKSELNQGGSVYTILKRFYLNKTEE